MVNKNNEKSFFKKSLAWLCTLALVITSTSAVFSFVASAVVASDKYVTDFSDGLTDIYTSFSENSTATVSTVTDVSEQR